MDISYAGGRQRKSITLIHRETIQLYEQTLTHGHKSVWEAGEQRDPFSPQTSPYAPPRIPQYTTQKKALVHVRPEDINIGLRHPVPGEQAAHYTGSAEATGKDSRYNDAYPRVYDMIHTRNQYRRTAAA